MDLTNSPLGKTKIYTSSYDPELLYPIPRLPQRQKLGNIFFSGVDIWNAYEISWLDEKGKPVVVLGRFIIPANSPCIIESKSFKLYLNSFNNTRFLSMKKVEEVIVKDLSKIIECEIQGKLYSLDLDIQLKKADGKNIDHLDVECKIYNEPTPELIKYDNNLYVKEEFNSNLLKSNCLVTGQPDFGTVVIKYEGKKLDHKSIIQYLVSFRNHNEFHEHCVERIFADIQNATTPDYLSVYARYTRRGGIDICPYRSSDKNFIIPDNERLIRQ